VLLFSHLKIRAFELETVVPEKLRAAASDVNTFVEKAKSVYSHHTAIGGLTSELLRLFGRQLGVGERTAKKSGVSGMGVSACKNLI